MLRQFGPSTWVALLLGSGIAAMLFVPVAAHRYRKVGRFRFLDMATLLLVAVYFVALWSYTLVPLPENQDFTCRRSQLRLFAFIADIGADHHLLLHNRALLQVLFNVALFLPLGFFLRMLARRGVLVATAVGLATSLAIEFTQKTGVWGIYDCAYRVFDVDDLLLNTLGATLGSVAAIPVAMLIDRTQGNPQVVRVTLGRRLVGILSDLMVMELLGFFLAVGWRVLAVYLLGVPVKALPAWVESGFGAGVPALVQLGWILVRGQTVGESAVGLEPVSSQGNSWYRRLLKFVFGVGGFLGLSAAAEVLPAGLPLFVVISVAMVIWTRGHRGLSHLVAGMELRVVGQLTEEPGRGLSVPSDY